MNAAMTPGKTKTSNAMKILHRRFVDKSAETKAAMDKERINVQVAQMIYDARNAEGLSQKQLADLIGTTQSVISRLEDSDYDGHSLTMLHRIAEVLGRRLIVAMELDRPKPVAARNKKRIKS
jgi:ribosome-binding protein aMBF1 (putative translation factor)